MAFSLIAFFFMYLLGTEFVKGAREFGTRRQFGRMFWYLDVADRVPGEAAVYPRIRDQRVARMMPGPGAGGLLTAWTVGMLVFAVAGLAVGRWFIALVS